MKVEKDKEKDTDIKVLKNSDKLIVAFSPIAKLLCCFGRLPFGFKRKNDGSNFLHFAPKTFAAIYFFFSSVFAIIILFMMVLGFTTMFFQVQRSKLMNRCSFTWEEWELKKYCVLVSLTVTWLLLTVVGSVYLIKDGHVYVHYFNYWFKAIDIMEMDVATGIRKRSITEIIALMAMVVTFIALYVYGGIPSLNEGSGSVANSIVRLFQSDIFNTDNQKNRAKQINKDRLRNVEQSDEYCGIFTTFDSYELWKLFGFFIQIYAILGSRIFIMQFRFFARILKNAVSIWNSRLNYALKGGFEVLTDQTKIRLDLKLLLKDHLILVQLFRMTETCFGLIVQSFYFVQVANVGFQLYFFSQVGTDDTCKQYLHKLRISTDEDCKTILQSIENIQGSIDIDDHVCGNIESSTIPNILLALFLFAQTIFLFTATTNSASNAYEQATEGFGIVRRHGFMFTSSRKERNFIHGLVVSFAKDNPMILSAAGYFIVSRPLTLVVIATVANYYIILLQFRPGEVGPVCGG